MVRRPRPTWPLLALALLAGCGPTKTQIWGAALVYAPICYLLGLVLVALLCAQRRRGDPELGFGEVGHVLVFLAHLPLVAWGWGHADFELVVGVLWLFGALHLALWLILWRLTLDLLRARAAWVAGGAASAITLAPAILGLNDPTSEFAAFGIAAWVWGGLWGAVPSLLLILLAIDGDRAARRAAAASAPAPPPAAPSPG